MNNKITLYNLDNEDKLFLKNLERKNTFIITDISSLNNKNIKNYNITLSKFDIKKLLTYYISLVQENKKEQISLINLKNNISEMKEQLLNNKNNDININKEKNNNKEIENKRNLSNMNNKEYNIQYNIKYNKEDNSNILSRYEKDLNYFEGLINNINEEIKKI